METNLSPEENANKLDQTDSVPNAKKDPWKNSEDMWTFQNVDDMQEYGKEIVSGKPGSSATVVLVIDNEDASLPSYQKNKHYWVLENADYGDGFVQLYFRHSVEYFSILVEEGSATMEDFKTESNLDFLGAGRKKVGSFQGFPIYIRDPAIDDSRPETQTSTTTGATTDTSISTTTTAKPGAAGVVTESKTTPGVPSSRLDSKGATPSNTNPDASDPRGRNQRNTPSYSGGTPTSRLDSKGATPSNPLDAFGGAGAVVGADGKIQQGNLPPCLPQNNGSGSGSTPSASIPYPDAILRQARAKAASVLEPFGGAGPNITKTSPTVVSQQSSTTTSGSALSTNSGANVYIYEPITPGFDRYDFNTGKKVYTPNNGTSVSRNSSGQPSVPDSTPTNTAAAKTTAAQGAEAAGYGSAQYGEFGPPTTSKDAVAAGYGSERYGEFGPPVTARKPQQTGPF